MEVCGAVHRVAPLGFHDGDGSEVGLDLGWCEVGGGKGGVVD